MLKTNEFNYSINPIKNTLTLTLTKKSKRNLLIRQLVVPTLVSLVGVAVIGAIGDKVEERMNSKLESETPDQNDN